MSYTYDDLKRVEARIKELNQLCELCLNYNGSRLRGKLDQITDELSAAASLIRGRTIWIGPDADSCAEALERLRTDNERARNRFYEAMPAMHSALMDEVHRQQAEHSRIYRELSTMEVAIGQLRD